MPMQRVKKAVRRSPLWGPIMQVRVLRDPGRRQQLEWDLRMDRDTKAMRAIVFQELRSDDAAVDVGAHEGEITAWLTKAAPGGRHHVVEPLPQMAAVLRERFPTVTVQECALSDTDGTATFFHVLDHPGWSGFRRQGGPSADSEAEKIEVAVRRLDDVVGDQPVRLVKIDVEGAEMGVLRGAARVLDRDRPLLLMEHARIHADPYGTQPAEVWSYLDERGYSVAPVADETRALGRDEFVALCEESHRTGYDRHAVTNWIARPR